jgi:hypothetical protein
LDKPEWFNLGLGNLDHCGSILDHWLQYRGWRGHRHYQISRMDQGQNVRQKGFSTSRRHQMKGFVLGTIFGIVICTVGLTGIARMLDYGVVKVQEISREAAK